MFERQLSAAQDRPGEPLVFAGGSVRSLDPSVGDLEVADVLVNGAVVTQVGVGLLEVRPDAVVVDCTGMSLVPAAGAAAPDASSHDAGSVERLGTLAAGSPATFAVLDGSPSGRPLEDVVWYPDRAAAVVVDGGVVTPSSGRTSGPSGRGRLEGPGRRVDSPHLGKWTDATADVIQTLTAEGRYDETRSGRAHAYDGSFWIAGDHIVYRDDLGFWAYGRFRGGVLHHVQFRFRRG